MKKVLLGMAAVAMITSCSQNEEFENLGQKAEIKMGTLVNSTSRAAVTDDTNFEAFKVTSFIVDAGANFTTTALPSPYMNEVSYKKDGENWTTTDANKYYWPADKNVQFFACPSDLKLVLPTTGNAGYPTLNFTIGATSTLQKDLVVASENMAKPVNNIATLNFKHILAQVNFSYKPDEPDYTYTITEIKITGVKGGSATYTYAADVAKGSWSEGEALADAAGYVYPITASTTPDADGYYKLDSTDGSLMLLPQKVEDAQISINYKTTKTIDTKEVVFFNGTKTVTLPTGAEWKVGKNIRYKLTLPVGAEKIGIATSVTDWDTETPETPSVDVPDPSPAV